MKYFIPTKAIIILLFVISASIGKAQTWQWAKSIDGSGDGEGTSVTTDTSGNVFVTGGFIYPVIAGPYTLTAPGNNLNVYLVKYDANGNVLWAKNSFGTAEDWPTSVKTDNKGNVYIAGRFSSPTINFGIYSLTNTGQSGCFLVKYDPAGNILWAKSSTVGGVNTTNGLSIDNNGNAYITGGFSGFTVMFDSFILTNNTINSGQNTFLVKYDPNGNVIWATSSSGAYNSVGNSADCDVNGNIIITGDFSGYSISFGSINLPNSTNVNIFHVKYDTNGNVLWAKKAVCAPTVSTVWPSWHSSMSVSVDMFSNSYITGYFNDSIAFDAYTLTGTGKNFFLTKYDPNGNVLWAKASIGSNVVAFTVSSYSCGVFLTGRMDSGTPLSLDNYTINAPYGYDPAFIAQYDLNGNVVYAEAFISGGDDIIACWVDKSFNAYVTGDFWYSYPMVIGTTTLIPTGGENAFTAKLSFTSTNCSTVGEQEHSPIKTSTSLYPNPNNGSFKLQMNSPFENGELIVINSFGQIIHDQKVINGLNDVIIKGVSNGLYYYTIYKNKQYYCKGKISIE